MKWLPLIVAASLAPMATPADRAVVNSDADSGPGTLRDAIAARAEIIEVAVPGPIRLLTELPDLQNLTIQAEVPAVITFRGQRPVMTTSGTVTLSNLVFRDCWVDPSSLISNRGVLNLIQCQVDNNFCSNVVGGIVSSIGALNATNSSFTRNFTQAASPTTYTGAGLPAYGGAVRQAGGSCTFEGCAFSNNLVYGGWVAWSPMAPRYQTSGESYGGALFATSSIVRIRNSSFLSNTAKNRYWTPEAQGGALFLARSDARIENCQFVGNITEGSIVNGLSEGAGIFSILGRLAIEGSRFEGNQSLRAPRDQYGRPRSSGAGVVALAEETTIANSTFTGNVADCSADVAGPFVSMGGNAFEHVVGPGPFQTTDQAPFKEVLDHPGRFRWITPVAGYTPKAVGSANGRNYIVGRTPTGMVLQDVDESGLLGAGREIPTPRWDYAKIGSVRGRLIIYLWEYSFDGPASRIEENNGQLTLTQTWGQVMLAEHGEYLLSDGGYKDGNLVFTLPNDAQIRSFAVDSAGNWYLGGGSSSRFFDVIGNRMIEGPFILKVSPNSSVLWELRGPPSRPFNVKAATEDWVFVTDRDIYQAYSERLWRISPNGRSWTIRDGYGGNLIHDPQRDRFFAITSDRPMDPVPFLEPFRGHGGYDPSKPEIYIYGLYPDFETRWVARMLGVSQTVTGLGAAGNLLIAGSAHVTWPISFAMFQGNFFGNSGGFVASLEPPFLPLIKANVRGPDLVLSWDNAVRQVLERAIIDGNGLSWSRVEESRSPGDVAEFAIAMGGSPSFFRLAPE